MKETILVIEDDRDLQLCLRTLLLDCGYVVNQAYTGSEGLKKLEVSTPNLVLLDLGLPDVVGETVCQQIKKYYPELPVIILTAKNTPKDAVKGFNLGADDYIPKPFDLEELLARIRTRLKKSASGDIVRIDDLTIDLKKFTVFRNKKKISLTPTEFKLLEYLVANKNQVLNRDMVLNHVWSYASNVETRVVDVYIGYLRKKIDQCSKTKLIHNIRGFGYSLKDPVLNTLVKL